MVLEYEILLPQLALVLAPFVVFAIWRWDSETAFTDRRLLEAQQKEKSPDGTLPPIEIVEQQLSLAEPVSIETVLIVCVSIGLYIYACYAVVSIERSIEEKRQIERVHQKQKRA
ncbi:unnamed protein product [Amoebophrya sp. A25]|nr:unnamed protein product [Amoebophrya sp. A25]|eukprot:GSA25T00000818001.1